jgi:formate hydrogenlyase subunit 6/NADH:ubiquinone oxidoreductase subunit I
MAYYINEQCVGCTVCSSVCPVKAISGALKQRHFVNPKRCIECGVCGKACPKDAIQDSAGNTVKRVPRTQWDKPYFDSRNCSACSICIEICRFKCIDLTRPQFKGDLKVYAYLKDPSKCVGCKMCAEECPLNVIAMRGEA